MVVLKNRRRASGWEGGVVTAPMTSPRIPLVPLPVLVAIDFLDLRTSTITDLLIGDCTITDLDLGGCRGTRIALRNCRLETLDVTRAALADVDLRSTTLSTVNGLEGLRGVTIDHYQLSLFAPVFASHLGVVVV